MCSRVPSLHGRYPASTLLRTQPPPSRLQSISRGYRLYDLPCSRHFCLGRGRLRQLLGMSLSPCCLYHPAGVTCRDSQIATSHTAFTRKERARPPDLFIVEATCGFTCVTARQLAHHPKDGFVSQLHPLRFLHERDSSYGASDSCPGGTCLPLNMPAFTGRTPPRKTRVIALPGIRDRNAWNQRSRWSGIRDRLTSESVIALPGIRNRKL